MTSFKLLYSEICILLAPGHVDDRRYLSSLVCDSPYIAGLNVKRGILSYPPDPRPLISDLIKGR